MGERTMNTWLGLLKWSLNYHDGTKPVGDASGSAVKPMSDADRAWLMQALRAHTVDEVERMKLIRSVLALPDTPQAMRKALTDSGLLTELHTGPGGVGGAAPDAKAAADADDRSLVALGVSEKVKALEELDERVETIDNALDFAKLQGLPVLHALLRNLRHPELVWRAAQVLSTILQNNPKCQAQAVDARLIDALLPLLDLFQHSNGASANGAANGAGAAASAPAAAAAAAAADVKAATPEEAEWNGAAAALTAEERERIVTKALLATSSLVRDNPHGLAQFLASGSAVDRLLRVAGASGAAPGLRRKAVSLLRHILSVAVEAQAAAAQAAAVAQAGPSAAAAAGGGVKVSVGERGQQKLGGVTITGGPAKAPAAAAAAAPAAAAAEPAAKTDVKSATAAVNGLKQSIAAAGGVGVLAALIDCERDVDLRHSAVELLTELLSGAPDAPGAAAALAALKAQPTHSTASRAIAARVTHYQAVATAGVNVADAAHADAVDACRAAYAELQLLWRLVQCGAFPEAVKPVGAEYRRFAVVVAKADAEERKAQAAAAKARGVGSLYSTSQAAPTRATHTNTDTPVVDTPLLK